MDKSRGSGALIAHYLWPYRGRGLFLAVLVIADIAMLTANPLIAAHFVNEAGAGASAQELLRIAVGFLIIALANLAVTLISGWLAVGLAQHSTNDLRIDLVDHVLQLDHAFLSRTPSGDLLERIDGDTTTLEQYLSSFIFDMLAASLLTISVVTVAVISDWRLGGALAVSAAIAFVIVVRAQAVARPWLRAERRARSQLSGFIFERLSRREDIRAASAENYTLDRLAEPLTGLRTAMARAGAGLRVSSSGLELGVAIASAAVLALGGFLLAGEDVALGTVFLAYQYIGVLSLALYRVSQRLSDLAAASGSLNRIAGLLALPVAETSGPLRAAPGAEVEFRDVSLSYDGVTVVLREVSFRVPAGGSLALIGRSGSGKSTASGLIWRAYDPDGGTVTLGGVATTDLPVRTVRAAVGVVTQETYLFHASLRDNVAVFDPTIEDAAISDALRAVGLSSWLAALPAGLNTVITGDGSSLSIGERHLLSMARVLVRDPRIVVMDEVTSHLDPSTEQVVHDAMARLMTGRTTVLVTHRGQALDLVDQVVVLEAGAVTWQGPRNEVPAPIASSLLKGAV
ncbi:ABC transporter ATP-binding protein [Micromonospora sp. M61]|uniref:ABC transporter ATP-binding protein n=1 Tax=Micromonospora sp. M61 TaxID=2824890 RepID=UPI001B393312|nr:ABC transporter ATP-binding protein [Micromonospora sp. M61]MBQ0977921.1 ABC transporter ATP-binding protein [Micromonospora sp. M61]